MKEYEIWEFSSAPEYNPRNGVVSVRKYPSDQDMVADYPKLIDLERQRRAQYHADNGHDDPFPRYYQIIVK